MSDLQGLVAIEIENFKSIKKARIELPGLSVLLGANSTGKSSVLQATLLFLQNLLNSRGQNIAMNGPLVRLGTDTDVLSNNQIGTCKIKLETKSSTLQVGFGGALGASTRGVTEFSYEGDSFGVLNFTDVSNNLSFVKGRLLEANAGWPNKTEEKYITIPKGSTASLNPAGDWLALVEEVFADEYSRTAEIQLAEDSEDPFGLIGLEDIERSLLFERANDYALLQLSEGGQEKLAELTKKHGGIDFKAVILGSNAAKEFEHLFSPQEIQNAVDRKNTIPLIEKFLETYSGPVEGLGLVNSDSVNESLWDAAASLNDMRNDIETSVLYLGPLRSGPLAGQRNDSESLSIAPLGLSGESAVKAIEARLQTKDQHHYPLPRKGKSLKFPTTTDLELALSAWANYLGLGTRLTWQDQGLRGFDFLLDGKRYDQLGTGVSQTMPVVIICLLAKPGQLVMLEQPELHLHPDAQQKLLDFFLACISTGRKILFETHSEYMINRLRRQSLAGLVKPEQVSLNFVERNKSGVSVVREAELTGSGGFTYWPKGFFGQIEDDLLAILEATPE